MARNKLGWVVIAALGLAGCASSDAVSSDADVTARALGPSLELKDSERLVTILGTNDLPRGLEARPDAKGVTAGGMALISGAVAATRKGLDAEYGGRANVVVVDAGDQFQGTLLSNYNEGQLMIAAMNGIGYDAAITGNHDYDFGPEGWLED